MSKKYIQVKVNFPPDDHKRLTKLAEEKGLSLAAYTRKKVGVKTKLNDIAPRKPKRLPCKKVPNSVPYHLGKIGTNLNQISEHCNIHKRVDQEVLNELKMIRAKIWNVE